MSNARLLAFTGPGIPVAAMGMPLVAFLPPYYSGELGLDLAAVGFVFFLVRALDVPVDPLVGHLADQTRTRLGRFKPWILGGSVLLFVSCYLAFFPPEGAGIGYLFAVVLVLYIGQSCVNVPHASWGASISEDYNERSRIFGFWQGGHMAGVIFALVLPAVLVMTIGDAAPPAVTVMGLFALISLPLTVIAAMVFVPRSRNYVEQPRFGWAELKLFFGQKELRALLVVDILFSLAGGALGSLLRFFLEQARGFTDDQSALMLLVFFISGFAFLPLWLRLAKRIGKSRAAALACTMQLVFHVAGFFIYDGNRVAISMIAMAAAGIGYAAPTFLMRAILADLADDARKQGAQDRIGLLNAVLTTAQKIGFALPVGLLFPLLDFAGFSNAPGVENGPEALFWLETTWISVLPLTLIPCAILLLRLRSDLLRHKALREAADGGT